MDLLSDILKLMKLKGTLYFRTDFSPPWGLLVPAYENVCRFHFVQQGSCWLKIADRAEPVHLRQGDLAIVTHGSQHVISDPLEARVKAVDQVVSESGFDGTGALVFGESGSGHQTQLVCGHFAFDREATHPLIQALPDHIHIKNNSDGAHFWLDSTLKLIGSEAGRSQLGGDLIAMKLSEIIFAQAIRTYLESDGRDQRVFAGFADSRIARTLQALHKAPSKSWTVEEMARVAGLSRTAFANLFHKLVGETPLSYLTHWRMQVARKLLRDSDAPMIEVAEQSGYRSEAAFGRVFKRQFNMAPAGYRRSSSSPPA